MKTGTAAGSQYTSGDNEDPSGLEKDIEVLHDRICEFEIYLMQMDAVVNALQKERDKMDEENIGLQKENERFHQEIKFEKIHNADLKNELKKMRRSQVTTASGAESPFCNSDVFGNAHPLTILRNLIHRVLLFTWWSGFWFYEGLSIFGWENKWAKMERKKKRLEEENKDIESEVERLKKYIAEQQKDLVSQKHTNFELLNQLTECVDVNNRKIMVLEEIWKKVEDYTNILEDHFDELKRQEKQKSTMSSRDVARDATNMTRDVARDVPMTTRDVVNVTRDVTSMTRDVVRDVTRDDARDDARDIPTMTHDVARDVANVTRDAARDGSSMSRDVIRNVARDIPTTARDVARDEPGMTRDPVSTPRDDILTLGSITCAPRYDPSAVTNTNDVDPISNMADDTQPGRALMPRDSLETMTTKIGDRSERKRRLKRQMNAHNSDTRDQASKDATEMTTKQDGGGRLGALGNDEGNDAMQIASYVCWFIVIVVIAIVLRHYDAVNYILKTA